MNEWLLENSWSLLIAAATVVSTWAVIRHRIDALEQNYEKLEEDVAGLKSTNTQNQIILAEIKKDIEYIRLQVSKLVN